jgi:hypothetical protein
MPTKSFWDWVKTVPPVCADCNEEPKDCMRCEIVWDAALNYAESAPTSTNNRSKEISLACNKLLSLRGQLSSQLTLAQYEDIGAVVAKLLAVR